MKILVMLLIMCSVFAGNIYAQKTSVTVVIDPGHGGSDPGHLPNDTSLHTEKVLNLKISKYLGGYIEKYLQNVKVVYTRTTDVYPSLDERVAAANNINADYFISIHCNGFENADIHGTETYVHSMTLSKSVSLAKKIENQFSTRAGRHSRGVKDKEDLQHSLQVLKYTNMTSVLVECGYVTNTKEAKVLNSTYGQEILASGIFRAFRSHIKAEHPSINFIKNQSSATASGDKRYWVQVMSSKQPVDPEGDRFNVLNKDVTRKKLQTSSPYKYIYLVGGFATKAEARYILPEVRKTKFSDAYIVYR